MNLPKFWIISTRLEILTRFKRSYGPTISHLQSLDRVNSWQKRRVIFPLFVWMDAFPKEGSGYPISYFASHRGTEQTFRLPYAGLILTVNWTQRLARLQVTTRTQAEFSLPLGEPRCVPTPGWTPGIVRNFCKPFQAFVWFTIHKPSSNSTVPTAWIKEPTMDSRLMVIFPICMHYC